MTDTFEYLAKRSIRGDLPPQIHQSFTQYRAGHLTREEAMCLCILALAESVKKNQMDLFYTLMTLPPPPLQLTAQESVQWIETQKKLNGIETNPVTGEPIPDPVS